jgi:hypothetical protein
MIVGTKSIFNDELGWYRENSLSSHLWTGGFCLLEFGNRSSRIGLMAQAYFQIPIPD